ncbi:MAG: hypothetical protein J7K36_00310 [Archaeoglobaceae archaeon]|nr:hypothetical protein [Archaeoglobaceae archaeon]
MSEQKEKGEEKKLTVKILRETRKPSKEALNRLKEQNKIRKAIMEALKSEPKTIPELASELNMDSSVIMWYVMTMIKYGLIEVGEEEDDYYKYKLAEG